MLTKLFFPYRCLLCQSRSDQKRDLCSYCQSSMQNDEPKCYQCGLQLPVNSSICGRCLRSPPAFDRLVAALDYTKESAFLLHHFKFHAHFASGRVLAELLQDSLIKAYQNQTWPELILPVPLHPRRLIERGFNQALVLAKNLNLPVKIDYKILARQRNTPHQVGLSGKWRKRNLKAAFKLVRPIDYKHVAIIDDVLTTGSTLQAISNLLKKSGVKQVEVWCPIRAQIHK